MILSRMRYAANDIHFFFLPPLLIGLGFKHPIFIIFLLIYLFYIFKKRIYVKYIFIISGLFLALFVFYKEYSPSPSNSFEGIVIEANDNKYSVYNLKGGVIIYSNESYQPGDIIKIEGEYKNISEASYEGGFSYKDYLKTKRIYYLYKNPTIIYKRHIEIPQTTKYRIHQNLSNRIDDNSLEYIDTLLLGSNNLDDISNDNIKALGMSHLFSISGFHVAFMYLFISFILSKIIKSERIRNNMIITFFIFYAIFTNFMISIMRSVIMIIFNILKERYNRLYTSLDSISFAGILLLILNPGYIYQTGFILTFLITFFLIITSKIIKDKNKIIGVYKSSLIAFLSSIPIIINLNNDINLLSILLIPLFSLIVGYILLPYSMLVIIIPIISKTKIIYYFEYIINKISKIEIFKLRFKSLNIYLIITYYLLFLLILIIIEVKKLKRRHILIYISYLMILFNIRYLSFYDKITFIDVGQGDSCLIELAHGKGTMLIDTYGYNINYIKSLGIKRIDKVLITHSDSDHSANLSDVIKEFKVGEVITNKYDSLNGVNRYVSAGDFIYLKNLRIDVLGPIYDLNDKNNNSVVLSFNISGYKILFTGDMEKEEEESLMLKYSTQLNSDILKVAHHGSNTSSTKEFISYVSPTYSIISCGIDNKYGFPNQDVLNRLSKSKIYRTDKSGNIKIIFKNNKIKINGYR